MIELEKIEHDLWSDKTNDHVIVEDSYGGSVFYVRDENGDVGVATDLATALDLARAEWGEVELAPAVRLRDTIENGDENDAGHYLLEYLATYGTAGIDAQALAQRVFERIEELD